MQWTNNPQLLWTKNDDDSAAKVLQNCGIAKFGGSVGSVLTGFDQKSQVGPVRDQDKTK